MQGLTLEVILRAVFGLDEGERLAAVRAALGEMLAFGEKPMALFGPPSERLEPLLSRAGPMAGFVDLRERVDTLIFELDQRAPRRATSGATTCSRSCSTRAMRTARRCPTRNCATS